MTQEGHPLMSLTGGKTGWAAAALIISGLSWALGYMGQPHLLTRFMAIKKPEQIKISQENCHCMGNPRLFRRTDYRFDRGRLV